ncbi:MAG TPA: TraX family protein [Alphaproteobacteria bacterium]|nr:hypothetical protein [Alphaproteobacteria bacterium]USO05837.1 MAG: hypothetical protein H6859_01130 [Rhodospirillales bacterium]HOO81928.1 TraX family protein [Alphaproteobacteria bacterium]
MELAMALSGVLKTQKISSALTSYDLLKALALVLMVVDHVGYFFFPEEIWLRVIGRLSVPVWFFLIGYAKTREVPRLFWILALVVAGSTLVSGEYLFPLNILFTLILARLSVDWLYRHALRNTEAFLGMFFLLSFAAPPSLVFIEYGTLGFLFTLMGALRRHKGDVAAPSWMVWAFFAAGSFAYILVQSLLLPSLSAGQFFFFVAGMVVLSFLLYRFNIHVFEKVNVRSFPPALLLMLLGRRTLEFYVLHLLVFRAVVMAVDPSRFAFGEFKVFAFSQLLSFLL